jgi:hypothetical protein
MSNGDSDVKLLQGQVKVEAPDLCVDSAARRKNSTQHRRALVHDFNDGLTINYANDYPAGVTISGAVNIGNATINKVNLDSATIQTANIANATINKANLDSAIIQNANIANATIHSEGKINDLLAHKIRMNGPLHALLTVKPGGDITNPPPLTSDEMFEQTSGASLAQVLQTAEQGVTEEFNIKVDLVDAVAELARMVLWLRSQLQQQKEKLGELSNEVLELKQTLASVDDNWRWCTKCEALFYAGDTTNGVCPAPAKGGSHEHSSDGSPNYRLLK